MFFFFLLSLKTLRKIVAPF